MKKIFVTIIITAIITFMCTYMYTMSHLTIKTDGDGDSAFVSCLGATWFTDKVNEDMR